MKVELIKVERIIRAGGDRCEKSRCNEYRDTDELVLVTEIEDKEDREHTVNTVWCQTHALTHIGSLVKE